MDRFLNSISSTVRSAMRWPAIAIDKISGGRVTPNHITLLSVLGHIGVFWALWSNRPIVAGFLLIVFGLMDSLDGALARLQGKASVTGMFYDASSDRLKEVLIYTGISRFFVTGFNLYSVESIVWLPVAVLGGSLLVSYIKAKGEVALSGQKIKPQELNRVFSDGLTRYEVRMSFIILGLFSGFLVEAMWVLLVLIAFTALQRTIRVSKALKDV